MRTTNAAFTFFWLGMAILIYSVIYQFITHSPTSAIAIGFGIALSGAIIWVHEKCKGEKK